MQADDVEVPIPLMSNNDKSNSLSGDGIPSRDETSPVFPISKSLALRECSSLCESPSPMVLLHVGVSDFYINSFRKSVLNFKYRAYWIEL